MTKVILSSLVTIVLFSGCGGSGNSDTSVDEESNQPPIVNAGSDKTVVVNKAITLTGTASDNDGVIVSYEWKKGTKVLGDTSVLNYLPTKVGVDTLHFTVMDDEGASSSDTVTITVTSEPTEESRPSEDLDQNNSGSKDAVFS